MKFYSLILYVIAALMMAACDSTGTGERLEHARIALDRDDFATARQICDDVRHDEAEADTRDITALCSLSMLYMRLSENDDREDNISYARRCYLDAFEADSAAAREYYDNLPVEEIPHAALLTSIVRSTTGVRSDIEEYVIENDSISGIK